MGPDQRTSTTPLSQELHTTFSTLEPEPSGLYNKHQQTNGSHGLHPNSDGLYPNSNGLHPITNGLQPCSDGFQPNSDGLQPTSPSNGLILNASHPRRTGPYSIAYTCMRL